MVTEFAVVCRTYRSKVVSRSHRSTTDASPSVAEYRLRRTDRDGLSVSRRRVAVVRSYGVQRPTQLRCIRRSLAILPVALSGRPTVIDHSAVMETRPKC